MGWPGGGGGGGKPQHKDRISGVWAGLGYVRTQDDVILLLPCCHDLMSATYHKA